LNEIHNSEILHEKGVNNYNITKKVAMAGIFISGGLALSYLNPFAYFEIFGTKINPFAHIINAMMGVLIGLVFASITALGIAMLRFSLGIGSIHAFHGGISGAIVVGAAAFILWKKKPKYVEFAALFEPFGTVFIGGTIANLIVPIGDALLIEGFIIYWILFANSSIPGAIIGFLILKYLKRAGISREDYIKRITSDK